MIKEEDEKYLAAERETVKKQRENKARKQSSKGTGRAEVSIKTCQ